jgi:hypothetical protein
LKSQNWSANYTHRGISFKHRLFKCLNTGLEISRTRKLPEQEWWNNKRRIRNAKESNEKGVQRERRDRKRKGREGRRRGEREVGDETKAECSLNVCHDFAFKKIG